MSDTLNLLSNQNIVPFLKKQIPEFYFDQSPLFIQFVEAYYNWLQQPGNVINQSRQLLQTKDIDQGSIYNFDEVNLANFDNTQLPGNTSLFLKNIYALYLSKGSPESIELFFRMVFNADSQVYLPSQDMFKASESSWFQPYYIEIYNIKLNYITAGQIINGVTSGASALIETVEGIKIANKLTYIVYITNIIGNFQLNETLSVNGMSVGQVAGSITNVSIITSNSGFSVGDNVNIVGSGSQSKATVTSVISQNGKVNFNLVFGGFGYTANAVVNVHANDIYGSGASFGFTLSNLQVLYLDTNLLSNYSNTIIGSNTYLGTAYGYNNFIVLTENLIPFQIGSISQLINLNAGQSYQQIPTITITDPVISTHNLPDGLGGILGADAIVQATTGSGVSFVNSLHVHDSGIGYKNLETVSVVDTNTSIQGVTGQIFKTGIGKHSGRWLDNSSILGQDTKIQDGYYYQDYSYEIQTDIPASQYKPLFDKNLHPIGFNQFNKFRKIDIIGIPNHQIFTGTNVNTIQPGLIKSYLSYRIINLAPYPVVSFS